MTGSPALSLWNVADLLAFSNHNESVSAINLTGGTINTGTGTLNLTGSLNYARSIWPATIQGNLSLGAAAGAFSVNSGKLDRLDDRGEYLRQSGRRTGENGQWPADAFRERIPTAAAPRSMAGNVVFSSTNSIPGSGTILLNAPGALNVTGAYSTVTGWLNSGKISAASTGVLALAGTSIETITWAPTAASR